MTDITNIDLQDIINHCLEDKLSQSFDSVAKLSVAVAKAVSEEILVRHADATDEAIKLLQERINNALVDTSAFISFMEEVNSVLTDEEGGNVVLGLMEDTVTANALTSQLTQDLENVDMELARLTEISVDHGERITVLEPLDRSLP